MNLREDGWREADVEVRICEPALAASTFDLVRTYAKAFGLEDTNKVGITLHIQFSGKTSEKQIEAFSDKLDELWLGQVIQLNSREWAERRGERDRS